VEGSDDTELECVHAPVCCGCPSARPGADGAEEYPDSRYTDRLGLLRIAGRWWIVSKLYVAERR